MDTRMQERVDSSVIACDSILQLGTALQSHQTILCQLPAGSTRDSLLTCMNETKNQAESLRRALVPDARTHIHHLPNEVIELILVWTWHASRDWRRGEIGQSVLLRHCLRPPHAWLMYAPLARHRSHVSACLERSPLGVSIQVRLDEALQSGESSFQTVAEQTDASLRLAPFRAMGQEELEENASGGLERGC